MPATRLARWLAASALTALTAAGLVAASAQPGTAPSLPPALDWAAAEGLVEQTARVTPEGIPPVDLKLLLQPEHVDRHALVVETVQAALKHYGEWYGAFPRGSLTVIDAPWWSDMAGASLPGVVVASARWLSPQGDRAFERQIIAGLARQYWSGAFGAPDGWMSEGLTLFSGTRAIHASLARTQYHTARYFGGFVPHVIRSVPLSEDMSDSRPYARHFDEVERPAVAPWRDAPADAGGRSQQVALALQTLERIIGWPALQQALAAVLAESRDGPIAPADVMRAVSDVSGRDLDWYFARAFDPSARFDYGIEDLTSAASGESPLSYTTTVVVRRVGDPARRMPVTVQFADGSEIHEQWHGREASKTFEYISKAPAVSARVDPDRQWLLDADPRNNRRVIDPKPSAAAARWTLHWVAWLQNLMLTCTALV